MLSYFSALCPISPFHDFSILPFSQPLAAEAARGRAYGPHLVVRSFDYLRGQFSYPQCPCNLFTIKSTNSASRSMTASMAK